MQKGSIHHRKAQDQHPQMIKIRPQVHQLNPKNMRQMGCRSNENQPGQKQLAHNLQAPQNMKTRNGPSYIGGDDQIK